MPGTEQVWMIGILFSLWSALACSPGKKEATPIQEVPDVQDQVPTLPAIPLADGFDFPVGPPNAVAYYNANPFGNELHLGDDWNGVGGGNTDLGDPVYSIANGQIISAQDHGPGWGNVVRIVHRLDSHSTETQLESLYAHLDSIWVVEGSEIGRGQQIGTIGNANGAYWAHLHLEIRTIVGMPLGGGYSSDTTGYTDPSRFIRAHRPDNR